MIFNTILKYMNTKVMRKLFLCLSVIGMILTGCSKNDDEDNGENEGKLPDLPALPDPDDVCSAMDDINFMSYCYENFDVNKDGKVSINEANAVKEINCRSKNFTSLKGIEYFSNLESLICSSNPIKELDIRYNAALTTLYCGWTNITGIDLSNNKALTSIKEQAFASTNLKSISIPRWIETIENGAFRDCTKLENVLFESNSNLKTIGTTTPPGWPNKGVFDSCTALTSIEFPEGLELLGMDTFNNCSLTSVIFPESIKQIASRAFWGAPLSQMICYAINPPILGSGYGSPLYNKYVKLYVPAKCVETYKKVVGLKVS